MPVPRYPKVNKISARPESSHDGRRKLSHNHVLGRMCSLLAFAVILMLLPQLGAGRWTISAVLILVGVPATVLAERYAPKSWVDLAHFTNDLATVVVAALVLPAAWSTTLVIMAALCMASMLTQSAQRVLTLTFGSSVGMFLTGWYHGIDMFWLPIVGLLALLPAIFTFKRLADRELATAHQHLYELVGAANAIFWEFDISEGRVTSMTGRTKDLVGYTPQELLDSRTEWFGTVTAEDMAKNMNERGEIEVLTHVQASDGTTVPFRHLFTHVPGQESVRGISFDATRDVASAELVRHQAEHDALTGLANRGLLVGRLTELLNHENNRVDDSVSLLILDLNRFKEVNDTLGHPVGDELLRVIGDRLNKLRNVDTVARLGGDEFAVVLKTGSSRREAVEMAQRVVHVVSKPVELTDITVSVTASVGVAMTPNHAQTQEGLIRCADAAMFEAKRHRLGLKVYEERNDDQFSLERLTLTNSIGQALDKNEFELWFQPKVAVDTGQITGAEGLLRWRHPERGLLAPAAFIEYITLAGEYRRITELVLHAGVKRARECIDLGTPLEIAVNMAAISFFDRELPQLVENLLQQFDVPPHLLTIEITETDILEDDNATANTLQAIGEMGVGLSIDDFGTGHSSLVRLRHLPVSEVKIDRSFVTNLHRDGTDFIITRSVIELAHSLGHRTVAEGVETVEAETQLRALGCDLAQGHLYSKAVSSSDFSDLLVTWPQGLRAATTVRSIQSVTH